MVMLFFWIYVDKNTDHMNKPVFWDSFVTTQIVLYASNWRGPQTALGSLKEYSSSI